MNLSVPGVESARVKVLKNACELLEEAELLFAAGRHARAFTLAHLATEEVVKIPMLVSAAAQAALGLPVDRKRLEKRLHGHKNKIVASRIYSVLHDDVPLSAITPALLSEGEVSTENSLKNRSLYCGFRGSSFEAPSEAITPEVAASKIADAKKLLAFFRAAEATTSGRLAEALASSDVKDVVIGVAERKRLRRPNTSLQRTR